ncbi:hypothetical protein [Paenibacillus sanguinis]|uniref:hypothetical protein n=1 Tax=Paenibacillus sanguinis TaxID=225906 RepID=UPI00038000ED|nr:hypothetical protein [Paenibacillus sanguinis]
MKKRMLISAVILTAALLGGCSANNEPSSAAGSQVSSESNSTKVEKEKKLTPDESLALSYVNDFLNGNKESKEKFVEEHVHPEVKAIFQLVSSAETTDENKLQNPVAAESVPFEEEGKSGSLVLIQSDTKELILLVVDGKVAFGYSPSEVAENQNNFDQIRSKFKTATK